MPRAYRLENCLERVRPSAWATKFLGNTKKKKKKKKRSLAIHVAGGSNLRK
jgi:hypothetical protein